MRPNVVLPLLACLALQGCPKQGVEIEPRVITRGGTPTPTPAADPVESARIAKLYEITVLEAARPWTPDGFAPWLADADPSVRAAAITGVGRAAEAFAGAGGDAKPFVDVLLSKAGDSSVDVRGAVAMAIGLVGPPASGTIEAALAAEANADVKLRWVRAAGRVAPIPPKPEAREGGSDEPAPADPAPSPEVSLLGKALGDPALAASAAWALGVFGLRAERGGSSAFLPPDVVDALKKGFDETAAVDREPFAYALWRLHPASASAELRAGLSDPSPRVRGWCARGLSAIPGTHARREISRLLTDSSSDVRVEASRAVTKLEDKDATAAVALVDLLERSDPPRTWNESKLGAQDVHSAVAAAEALGELGFRATSEALRSRLASDSPYLFGAAVVAYAKTARMGALGDLEDLHHERLRAGDWRYRRSIAEALAYVKPKAKPAGIPPPDHEGGGEYVPEVLPPEIRALGPDVPVSARRLLHELLEDRDVRVAAAALDSYGALAGASAAPRMLAVLGSSEDVALIGTAADKLASLESPHPETGPALVRAFVRLSTNDPETAAGLVDFVAKLGGDAAIEPLKTAAASRSNALMLAASKALRAKGLTPPMRTEPPAGLPTKAEYLEAADWTRMTIHTKSGEIRLQLYPEIAPITVWQIGTLARKGYFREGSFHRVVPAFVAQGGDPRGDGWGGPDRAAGQNASMPCELSDRGYDPGTLGMALSGRDTGGSQFFIALTPLPHLDSGYTVFGKVLRGEETVETLEIGDEIVDITVP